MTNNMIIFNESVQLMEQGILSGSGRFIPVPDENGNEKLVEVPEEIHTFSAWKARGYIVKKGEHAVAVFHIWKYTARRIDAEDGDADGEQNQPEGGRCFLKKSFFFKRSQVEKIA